MIDTCVNSDWAKTITVTFVLKLSTANLFLTPVHMRQIFNYWLNVETNKILNRLLRLDLINIFILISFILKSFKKKVFTQINSQQMNTFRIFLSCRLCDSDNFAWMQ